MKKVIVIGAGLGGLASGIRLLKAGYQVDIYEKNDFPGGKIHQIAQEGFLFPIGPCAISSPQQFQELFSLGEADINEVLALQKPSPMYEVFFSANPSASFSAYSDLPSLIEQVEQITPGQSKGFLTFLGKGQENLSLTKALFATKPFSHWKQFFHMKTLAFSIRAGGFSSSRKYMGKTITDTKLIDALSFFSLFEGPAGAKSPSWQALKPTMDFLLGSWQVQGGLNALVHGLEQLFVYLGGTLHYRTPVDKILIENQKAYGVQIGNQLALSDHVLCNADFPYALKHLIKSPQTKGSYTDEKIDSLAYSPSALIIGLGMKKPYPLIKTDRYFISRNMARNAEQLYNGQLIDDPSFLLSPAFSTLHGSSSFQESLCVMVPVSNLRVSTYGWEEETITYYKKRVLETLQKVKGFEDIQEQVDRFFYFTPLDFQSKFNAYNGACFGLLPLSNQSYFRKPQNVLPTCEGLYFIGSSIHPGPGIPFVLQGAKNAVEALIEKDR
ncbi:MAG: phytoene desaturase [Clostridiales bacterium]|nr:phytoene desaturase [Clostridiales bacterium]